MPQVSNPIEVALGNARQKRREGQETEAERPHSAQPSSRTAVEGFQFQFGIERRFILLGQF